jgi:acetyltransferase-like isoleucine patch superfamily enzyme
MNVSKLLTLVSPSLWAHLLKVAYMHHYNFVAEAKQVHLGEDARLTPSCHLRFGHNIEIGDRTVIGHACGLWAAKDAKIIIGRDVMLAPDCFVSASNYDTKPGQTIGSQAKLAADVRIGDDVWLARGVTVLMGVTIGDGCIVGANSVVTRDLPPGAIAGGVPAKVLKYRDGRRPGESEDAAG